jgi:hypothetical protein
MIHVPVSPTQLRRAINKVDSNWDTKAAAARAALPANPTSKQYKSLWSDIKAVWTTLQNSKCIYCESLLEGDISRDIEHFRPKAKVANWKVPRRLQDEGVTVTAPATPKGDIGYRNLAYDPWNYAASCKVCNSVLKKNYFPIVGPRDSAGTDARSMRAENPYFIYPIGNIDRDPESLIRFVGMHPEPAAAVGSLQYRRALVVLEIFQLNDADKRKELFQIRGMQIRAFYLELEVLRTSRSAARRDGAQRWINFYLSPGSPHSSCMRCFFAAYQQDRNHARQLMEQAETFIQTGSLPN